MEQEKSNEYRLLWAEIRYVKKLLKERDKALRLQRKENDRRLSILNNEHGNIRENQAHSVLREVYASEQAAQNKEIKALTEWKSNQQGRQTMVLLGWGIVMIIISAVVSYMITKI